MARLDVAVAALFALIGAALTIAMPALIDLRRHRDRARLRDAVARADSAHGVRRAHRAGDRRDRSCGRDGTQRNRAPRPDEWSRLQRAGIATLIAVAYAASVPWLGYILATMLMTAVMAWYLGLRNPIAFVPGVSSFRWPSSSCSSGSC
jgi:Flp pilus assembly protein TadB